MNAGGAPIIVSALLGDADFAWLDGQRRAYFLPDRNVLPAHLTMFHHLPPTIERELHGRLAQEARGPRPDARITGLLSLGRGVAYRIESPALAAIRDRIADPFSSLLTPQDAAPWRPHVTVQNKATPDAARRLLDELTAGFHPRALVVSGLAAWWYRGGPWELIARHMFRG